MKGAAVACSNLLMGINMVARIPAPRLRPLAPNCSGPAAIHRSPSAQHSARMVHTRCAKPGEKKHMPDCVCVYVCVYSMYICISA